MSDLYLGIEIGGTKQQTAVCGADGSVIKMLSERVPHEKGASDILAWLEPNIAGLLDAYPSIRGIGAGFGGPLESASGRVLTSVQVPGWENFELKSWLDSRFGLPSTVVNDTVAGGYAELKIGSGTGSKAFFYTNIGTGIGGALFAGGLTWDGTGKGGAYLGNTYIADTSPGMEGTAVKVESLCSGTAIEKRLSTPGYIPASSSLYGSSRIDCRALGEAAADGDSFALGELDGVGRVFGLAVANVITLTGVDTVSIGGGLANLGELLLAPIRKYALRYVFVSGIDCVIKRCGLLDDNVPVGAALYARDGFRTI